MSGRVKRWILHGAVLAVVAFLAWRFIDFRELGHALRGVRLPLAALLVVLHTLDRVVMGAKWCLLMRAVGLPAPLGFTIGAYYQSAFTSRIVPTSLPADILRGYLLGKRLGRMDVVAGSMVVEKVVAVISAVTIATAGVFLLAGDLAQHGARSLAILVPATGVLVYVLFRLSFSERLAKAVVRLLPGERLRRLATKLHTAYALYRGRRGPLFVFFLLTLLAQGIEILILVLCARAVGLEAPAMTLAAVLGLSQFARKVSIVLEGYGFAEFSVVSVCALAGLNASLSLALSLLSHATGFIASLPGGAMLLFRKKAPSLPPEPAEAPDPARTGPPVA